MEKKKVFGFVGAIALTAAIAVSGTLAYLNNITDTKVNMFSSSKNIKTTLTEEAFWDTGWTNYTPGESQAKTPVITNKSDATTNTYVAMRLDFIGYDNSKMSEADFQKYASLNYTGMDSWTKIKDYTDGSVLYLYKTSLTPNQVTAPLFNKVTVNKDMTGALNIKYAGQNIWYNNKDGVSTKAKVTDTTLDPNAEYLGNEQRPLTDAVVLPSFTVNVKGFAIQAEGFATADAAKAELIALSDANR